MAIEAGQCEVALVASPTTRAPARGRPTRRPWGDDAGTSAGSSVVAGYAMIARRYMQRVRHARRCASRAIAVACRKHGAANPNAQLAQAAERSTPTRHAPWVVEPLRRDDCCLISDGAAAVVVMIAERAARAAGRRAGADPRLRPGPDARGTCRCARPDADHGRASAADRVRDGRAEAGATSTCAQIYDCFTITVADDARSLRLLQPGQGGRLASQGGGIELGGALPLNTSGGLLVRDRDAGPAARASKACARCAARRRTRSRTRASCIVSNQGGIMHTHSTLILGQ